MKNQRRIDPVQLIDELGLTPSGGGGWYSSKGIECPECNKGGGKFGIKIKEGDSALVNCWRCGYKDSIFSFLFKINKLELVQNGKKYDYTEDLGNVFAKKAECEELPEEQLPRGFKLIHHHPYLKERGFQCWQYDQYRVGITDSPLEPLWRNKIIFQIINNGKRVGLLGRSTKDKGWHDQNMLDHKENGARLELRYKNSGGDFNLMLGGLDDITPKTDTVIIVEGLMDKANIDRLIKARYIEEIQCVYCFGSSISKEQLTLLKRKFGINKVIFLFDPDALNKVRHYVAESQKIFNEVMICSIDNPDIDAGDMNVTQLIQTFKNIQTPDEFYSRGLIIKKIR